MRPRPPGRTRDLSGSDVLPSCVTGSSTTAERQRLAIAAQPMLPSALSTASASAMCNFRGSITHPTRSLCTLRNRRHRRSRNTRYRAGATPYLGWTSTGWITSASPDAPTVYWTSQQRRFPPSVLLAALGRVCRGAGRGRAAARALRPIPAPQAVVRCWALARSAPSSQGWPVR